MITENYDGEALALGESELVLSPEMFPHLKTLKGRTLITSDGTTILGADDKAGIAEILTMVERMNKENISHGPLCIAFTPDEETGTGAAHFDVDKFGADFAYTLDGDTENEIQYENFNACGALVEFHGVSVHPGSSKDTMVNASLVARNLILCFQKVRHLVIQKDMRDFIICSIWKENVHLQNFITLS